MNGLRLSVLAALLLLTAASPACRWMPFHRKPAAAVPPPPKPVVTQPVAPPPVERTETASVPDPPQLPEQPDFKQTLKLPARRLPPPPRRTAWRKAPPPVTEPRPEPVAAAPAPPVVPQLEQILTPRQQQDYNESIDRNITRAQKTVEQLNGRRLNPEQNVSLDRIRAYIQQANDARKSDLFRARDLAERASVLAEDLLKSVQ